MHRCWRSFFTGVFGHYVPGVDTFDVFIDLKDKQLLKNKESYEKYMYALKLRTEAAQQIGIENIRKSRIARLQRERDTIEENYKNGQQVYPDFRLVVLVKLEA